MYLLVVWIDSDVTVANTLYRVATPAVTVGIRVIH
jgi:hypothetical protein